MPALEHPDEDWDEVIEVNLSAQFILSREIGKEMVARGRGKIIFTASMLTFQGGITVPGYAASKGGIGQLAKALANEWAGSGVQVNAIAPGWISTDLTQAHLDWLPPGGKNSIGDLLRHISETEIWWIHHVVLKNADYHDLTREMAPDIDSILTELEKSHKYVLEVLESKTIDHFDEIYTIPDFKETFSLYWILWHTIEHEMRHRGQIFMMMRLQGIAPPNV